VIRGKKPPVIKVIAFRKTKDSPLETRVSPEILDMTQYAKGRQVIRWRLDTVGYEFPTDGTAIEFTSPGAEASFGKVEIECDGRVASVLNKNRDGLAFAYNVRVVDSETREVAFLDPQIQNNSP